MTIDSLTSTVYTLEQFAETRFNALLADSAERAAHQADSLAVAAQSLSAVFGDSTTLADGTAAVQAVSSSPIFLCDNLIFKLAVLICFAGYCLLLYHFKPYIHTLWGMFRSKLYIDKLLDEQSYVFDTFLSLICTLGLLAYGITAIRYADLWLGAQLAATLPPWAINLLSPGLWGIAFLVSGYQFITLKIAGNLTRNGSFICRLLSLRKLLFALSTILLTPLLFLLALSSGTSANVLASIFLTGFALMFLFLCWESYLLFLEQKISILYWILYLCAVEIFPISFIILITVQNT